MLRLRSVIDTISREFAGERVLIFSHQVVVNCFRYLLEGLTEEEVLEIDRQNEIANCSITSYRFEPQTGSLENLLWSSLISSHRSKPPVKL
ncbi:MAG: phosphoglycerate mutase family protein [Pyrinomonadaceae bacterium]